jgi:hypothetical protein
MSYNLHPSQAVDLMTETLGYIFSFPSAACTFGISQYRRTFSRPYVLFTKRFSEDFEVQ